MNILESMPPGDVRAIPAMSRDVGDPGDPPTPSFTPSDPSPPNLA